MATHLLRSCKATASLLTCIRCLTSVQAIRCDGSSRRFKKAKDYRVYKIEILRQNRRNPELEEKARLQKLLVPLEEVREEWLGPLGRGICQLQTAAHHCNIYRDVFGTVFRPSGFLKVLYSDVHEVTWGDMIPAKHTLHQPRVILPSTLRENYASLTLTNPDGHLQENSQELLHWMVVNIPVSGGSGDISAGLTRAHYLPPVPPQGTGLHRFVFSLYTHSEPLPQDHTHEVGVVTGEWLQQRLFSSAKFLETAGVTPQTFCFFQCQWDKSVRHTYKNVLKYPEPIYGPERILGPRKTRQILVRGARQSKYTEL